MLLFKFSHSQWIAKNNRYFRVEKDIEIRGLDIKKHGEPAYPTAAYGHGWDKEGDYATNWSKWSNQINGLLFILMNFNKF